MITDLTLKHTELKHLLENNGGVFRAVALVASYTHLVGIVKVRSRSMPRCGASYWNSARFVNDCYTSLVSTVNNDFSEC